MINNLLNEIISFFVIKLGVIFNVLVNAKFIFVSYRFRL